MILEDSCDYAQLTLDPAILDIFPSEYLVGLGAVDVILDDSYVTSNYTGPCS